MDAQSRAQGALRTVAVAPPTGLQRRIGPEEISVVLGPSAFFLAAMGLLTFDRVQGHVGEAVFWVGLGVVVIAFAWMLERAGRTSREAAEHRHELLRDHLTGLGSEAALRADLGRRLAAAEPAVLFLVEIDSGDPDDPRGETRTELVREVGEALADAAKRLAGLTYRIDGSRFGIVIPSGPEGPETIVAAVQVTLGRDLLTGVHHGAVILPEEAGEPELALELAEVRLNERRRRGLRSARRQAHSALLAALGARRPELRRHVRSVVPKVIAVGRRLGLSDGDFDDVVFAASLQDIGLLSVPESILEKAGPLTEAERAELHKHPLAGERIVASATSLAPVAALVRAAYERWDGSGYPDGLAGTEIPLGARIIAPCVALAAMTATRPHRGDLDRAQAIAELRAEAGGQFDPDVVRALVAEVEADSGRRASSRRPVASGERAAS